MDTPYHEPFFKDRKNKIIDMSPNCVHIPYHLNASSYSMPLHKCSYEWLLDQGPLPLSRVQTLVTVIACEEVKLHLQTNSLIIAMYMTSSGELWHVTGSPQVFITLIMLIPLSEITQKMALHP